MPPLAGSNVDPSGYSGGKYPGWSASARKEGVDVTVVVPEGGNDEAAVAAGAALATAVRAAEDAEEAGEAASVAEMVAGEAVEAAGLAHSVAAEAHADAFDARVEVDNLRREVMGRLDEIAASVRPAPEPEPEEEVVTVPPKESAKEATPEGSGESNKSAETTERPKADKTENGYGSRRWFGNR